jgi:hypothetical protein
MLTALGTPDDARRRQSDGQYKKTEHMHWRTQHNLTSQEFSRHGETLSYDQQ